MHSEILPRSFHIALEVETCTATTVPFHESTRDPTDVCREVAHRRQSSDGSDCRSFCPGAAGGVSRSRAMANRATTIARPGGSIYHHTRSLPPRGYLPGCRRGH